MFEVKKGEIPIKIWTEEVEKGALEQAVNLSNLPFAFRHISLMPDVHQGYGMPIGGILATKEKMIIPNAVGVDIGCGVTVLRTNINHIAPERIKSILQKLKEIIPVGFNHHKKPVNWSGFKDIPQSKLFRDELKSAKHQLCTLGGGNHFCSIEKGGDGNIWLMVHSGSRNLGFKVARYFNNVAKKINSKERIVPKEYDLAPLSLNTPEGEEYLEAMKYCLKFAKTNREMLLTQFFKIVSQATEARDIEIFDCHHNFASQEKHFDEEVIVHRKGAIKLDIGEKGIIPGSMGTPSFIVEGLGNPESFNSCSHGAGRIMSRKEANKIISKEKADKSMEGIIFDGWKEDYSEAPMAYKNIEKVMRYQSDLVNTIIKLNPLGVMKG